MKNDMCCLFNEKDPVRTLKNLQFELVQEYGSRCNGHDLHTWDHGERFLVRCRHCGKLLLIQDSEYIAPGTYEESIYRDIYPVSSEEEAEELNQKYDVFSLEANLERPALFITDGVPFWH